MKPSQGDKIAIVSAVVTLLLTVVGMVVGVTTKEIRGWAGLDPPEAPDRTDTPQQQGTTRAKPELLPNSSAKNDPPAQRPSPPPQPQPAADHVKALRSTINSAARNTEGKWVVGIAIESSGPAVAFSPAEALYGRLQSDSVRLITNVFADDKRSLDQFRQIYNGNAEAIRKIVTQTGLDLLIVGTLLHSFRRDTAMDSTLVSCDLTLTCKRINQSGLITKTDSIRVTGAAFSEAAAIDRGIDMLSRQVASRFLKEII